MIDWGGGKGDGAPVKEIVQGISLSEILQIRNNRHGAECITPNS